VPRLSLILVCLAPLACGHALPPSAPNPMLGKSVSLSLPTDDGALVTLPVAGARVTVVDFFSPTCEPCKVKVPELVAREGEIRARGGQLVLVAVLAADEPSDAARAALASWGVTHAFLVDNGSASRTGVGVDALPATLVLDAQGTLAWSAPATAAVEDVLAAVR